MKKSLVAIYKGDNIVGVYDSIKECSSMLQIPRGTIKSWLSRTKNNKDGKMSAYYIER